MSHLKIQSSENASAWHGRTSATGAPLMAPWPGLALVAAVAIGAVFLSQLPFPPFTNPAGRHAIDPVIIAIIIGVLLGNLLPLSPRFQPGIQFSAKKILALGIILLGVRLDFLALLKVGATGIALSAGVAGFAMLLFYFLAPRFRLAPIEGILLGVGTAICGGTAIVAVAPLLRASKQAVVVTVATVTLLGLIAMLLMPMVAGPLELSAWEFGVWTGLTIHQTPQVIAAGFAHSAEAGQTATIIKLARVCLLAPVAFAIAIYQSRQAPTTPAQPLSWQKALSFIPSFILGFIGLALARTLGLIPDIDLHWVPFFTNEPLDVGLSLTEILTEASAFLLTMSMAAVGLETKFQALRQAGARPFLAAATVSLAIALVTLGLIRLI